MQIRLASRFPRIALSLIIGAILGLALIEVTVRLNPTLLLRGMAVPAPVDPPITSSDYTIHNSDADVFLWIPDQIRPIPAVEDKVAAQVHFQVDELGFPGAAPVPSTVDVVILGRSYALGAQAAQSWPRLLAPKYGLKVLNLSLGGNGIDLKLDYLQRFGLPRYPHWIVVEVLPSMDILGYQPLEPLIIQRLAFPVLQSLIRNVYHPTLVPNTTYIYPLTVSIHAKPVQLTFFPFDLAALTADRDSIANSRGWSAFSQTLLILVDQARQHSACVTLLYAPTKPAIYVPLVDNPDQLQPAVANLPIWQLDPNGDLGQQTGLTADIPAMQHNAATVRALIADFATQHHLPLIDPTDAMTTAILSGQDTFMRYDTHWSAAGHQIVADQVGMALRTASCP